MNTYSVRIIGAGNKGAKADAPGSGNEHKYLSYAHAVTDHTGFELTAFTDTNTEKARNAAVLWGVNKGIEPDVFVIATPDDTHYPFLQYILHSIKPQPKIVICEKPLCMELDQAELIVERYKEAGIPLLVDYTRRFIPYWQRRKMDIDNAGEFLKGYCYFNRGWEHTASHFIDLALWFNGSLDGIDIQDVPTDYRWAFQWGLFYERDFASEHAVNFTHNPAVPSIYDNHIMEVMNNAYNHLEHGEPLKCTGEDALKAIRETKKLMERGCCDESLKKRTEMG